MPNRTPTLESGPSTTGHTDPPGPVTRAPGIGRVFEFLLIPLIVVGYHVAVTILKMIGHRDE
jgi:hypothetical protein